ncbi:MerR family DNA-binding transcriptional regulator [Streptomyces niphimycinicus]|uniref:MerR family DNA-binding transcriptional regulator n=1 Tax=Streptomyces niphimycinicus TaxID=2842201 RepID=UPI00263BBB2A|nr:MerR family DNA-binding transcriptional regulator [Streptomyces niphimycinicus]
MRISQLAERTGIPATTLRFYDDAGLLSAARNNSASRRNPGTRQITPSHARHNDPGTGQSHMIDRTANRSRISPL